VRGIFQILISRCGLKQALSRALAEKERKRKEKKSKEKKGGEGGSERERKGK